MGCASSKKNISVCKSLPFSPAVQQEVHNTAVEVAPVSLVLMGEKEENSMLLGPYCHLRNCWFKAKKNHPFKPNLYPLENRKRPL